MTSAVLLFTAASLPQALVRFSGEHATFNDDSTTDQDERYVRARDSDCCNSGFCSEQNKPETSFVRKNDVPQSTHSSEATVDEILTEIRALLPDANEGHFLCLERTLREMGVLSRKDMEQVKPVDLVNALGTDKANKVAAHFNPDYAESSVHKILGAVGRSYENAEFALHTFSAAAQEIASTLREECKMTRDCLLGAIRSVNMCPSEADRASECTTSGKDEDFPGLKRAQEVRKMEKQESTCSERTLLHENRDKNKDMKKGYWKLLKPYFKLRHKHRNL